ncbi:hypothetical protein CYMTET_10247 [Cymbomonas tetramitiformis]|uniref:HMA domain-containing protein n=1 Tax=Cymbomonas tetramitiformis TaxID=36881 RepID=A0AAE0GQ11_9CHLO|nr:hypothetical protein CYMTET_10247 [Cymbomonas tetramitiformis]
MSTTVTLRVDAMMCEGCVGAVRRVLEKLEGVENVVITLEDKKVVVTGTGITEEAVLEKVAKTGKAPILWSE